MRLSADYVSVCYEQTYTNLLADFYFNVSRIIISLLTNLIWFVALPDLGLMTYLI